MTNSGENAMHKASSRFSQKRETIHLMPMPDGRAAITFQIEETMCSHDAKQQSNAYLNEIDSDSDFDDDYTDPDLEDDISDLDLDDDDSEEKGVSVDDVTVSGICSCKECGKQNRCVSYLKRNADCMREEKRS